MEVQQIISALRPHIKNMVREALKEILLADNSPHEELLKPKDALKPLGYSSLDAFYTDIDAGLLRPEIEVFDKRKPGGKKARWLVDVSACRKRFAEDPENRRAA